jgi:DNA-binding HxlR family transcriptional regulator
VTTKLSVKAYNEHVPKPYGQPCPVAKSLEFLGERWTLLLVRDLLRGPKKFHDLQASLKGVAPGVLSHRLKVLEDNGIVDRRLYSEHPPRAEYTLTDRGLELRPIVRALAIWGAKHLDAELVLVHDACETPVEMAYYCPTCEAQIDAAASSYRRRRAPRPSVRRRSRTRLQLPRATAARRSS